MQTLFIRIYQALGLFIIVGACVLFFLGFVAIGTSAMPPVALYLCIPIFCLAMVGVVFVAHGVDILETYRADCQA